jgi:hypothetical protein
MLIGVSDEARKSESVARDKEDRTRLIATPLAHIGEADPSTLRLSLKCGLAARVEYEIV